VSRQKAAFPCLATSLVSERGIQAGGGSGIGRGLAEALHKLGNQVIISGRRKGRLAETIGANPGMQSVELDVADPASIGTVADYPQLNVLINNAGVMQFDDAAGTVDEDVLALTITTNLLGPIRMSSALIEYKSISFSDNKHVTEFFPIFLHQILNSFNSGYCASCIGSGYKTSAGCKNFGGIKTR